MSVVQRCGGRRGSKGAVMPREATVPSWVIAQDGRIGLFDSEQIVERLFAATDLLDRPDPLVSCKYTPALSDSLRSKSLSLNIDKRAFGAARQIRPRAWSIQACNHAEM